MDTINSLFFSKAEYRRLKNNSIPKLSKNYLERNLYLNTSSNIIIIYPPTIDWEWMTQRPQHLMNKFATDYEVFYCNKTQSNSSFITQQPSKLKIVHKNKKFIKRVIPQLKTKGKKIILWVSWPMLYSNIYQYQPDMVIFDYIDDFPFWASYVPKMVKKADLIFTTAEVLQKQIARLFPSKPCYRIPNGCNIEHFIPIEGHSQYIRPKEYQNHDGPIITYVGAWASWVDQALVRQIATSFPKSMVSVIGIEFGEKVDLSLRNISYLGYKPYHDLPKYLHFSDVCIIPFKYNRITKATNPVKMYEYLAAGKPVVSSDLPEVRNVPNVRIGRDEEEFIRKIRLALSTSLSSEEKNQLTDWLSLQTWENRYQKIIQILKEYDKQYKKRCFQH
ncbi:MAG: glycosyltransferase [Clostridia bacterium]|jgi:glycosyltransferase involved in cell wall biosynthesis|nr:glycosyltransferase [Clostridia bacterium]